MDARITELWNGWAVIIERNGHKHVHMNVSEASYNRLHRWMQTNQYKLMAQC